MTAHSSRSNDLSEDDVIGQLMDEFLERHQRGEEPSVTEYAERYPHVAAEIQELFPALLLMKQFGQTQRSARNGEAENSANRQGSTDLKSGSEAALPSSSQVPTQLGDYRIVREVGRGGMGVVYEAVQESLGRQVAIKLLPISGLLSPGSVERFQREAKSAAKLHHSNIVPVFDVGEQQGLHYYAMQFIDGQSLAAILHNLRGTHRSTVIAEAAATSQSSHASPQQLAQRILSPTDRSSDRADRHDASGEPAARRQDFIPPSDASFFGSMAAIGLQVAEALTYAHRQGVLHRDIKPANLLLDLQGTVWVTDFGLAKAEGSGELTQTGDLIGTLRYMAPEGLRGISDARSDVYGLGVTLYELLTLRPAFAEDNRHELIERVAKTNPSSPRTLVPRLPRDLETIVLTAIAKDPAQRYASAEALAEDLQLFLADRPIRARRISAMQHLWRWCRRNPTTSLLSGSVAGLLVMLAIGSFMASLRLKAESQRAIEGEQSAKQAQLATDEALAQLSISQIEHASQSTRSGRHFESLDLIRQLVGTRPALEMRNLAIECLTLPDARLIPCPSPHYELPPGTCLANFDADWKRMAIADLHGVVSVRSASDGHELIGLPGSGNPVWVMQFSPNGRLLAVKSHAPQASLPDHITHVWDLDRREIVFTGAAMSWLGFSPDSRRVAMGKPNGVLLFDLATPDQPVKVIATNREVSHVAFHPDGNRLAIADMTHTVAVHHLETGQVQSFAAHASARALAWHPHGSLLAAACINFGGVCVWDGDSGRLRSKLEGSQATLAAFNHSGERLLTTGWDAELRLWDPWTGQLLVKSHADSLPVSVQFRSDDQLAAIHCDNGRTLYWEMPAGRECRTLTDVGAWGGGPRSIEYSADGRLLAAASDDSVRVWEPLQGRELARLNTGTSASAFFLPAGEGLIVCGETGLALWPIVPNETESGAFEIGPARQLVALARDPRNRVCLSIDGRMFAVSDRGRTQVLVQELEFPESRMVLSDLPWSANVAISPDKKWLATGSLWSTHPATRVWDLSTGKVASVLPFEGDARVAFSADGQWLLSGTGKEYRFWEVGTWQPGRIFPREEQRTTVPSPMAFALDRRLLAITPTSRDVQLIDLTNGELLATLHAPNAQFISWLCFSPDSSHLAVANENHSMQLWDLRLLRERLSDLGLDWPLPPYAPPSETAAPVSSLRVPPAE